MKMPTTRHRSLVERGGRKAFVRDKVLAHKKGGKNENLRGSHNIHSTAVHAKVWTPVGTGLSTHWDGTINARPTLAGQQRRLTGHKYLRNQLSHRDVSSCRFFCKDLSPLHAVGVLNIYGSGRRG
jgi:hypothetical protein